MTKARELAELGAVYDSGALSNRNLIINGAMQVAQRGTSFTPASATTTYTIDRFSFYQNAGTVGVDQATDSPDGFEYSLKCEVDTTGSVASGTILQITQPIEGYNLSALDWNGGSNAKPATASFWVKSSEAGVYGFRIRLGGAGTFIKEFTINASNTWEHKTVSIPACPYTIPNKTSGTGIFIGVQLVSGSTYYATSDGVWQTADAYGTSGMDNDWIATSGATFYLTGVQLEVGPEATPFEHRSYGDELARCQRYFFKMDFPQTTPFGPAHHQTTNTLRVVVGAPQPMRTTPSMNSSGQPNWFIYWNGGSTSTTVTTGNSFSVIGDSLDNNRITLQANVTGITGLVGGLFGYSGDFDFDAEL